MRYNVEEEEDYEDDDEDYSEQPGPSTLGTPIHNTSDIKRTLLECPELNTIPVTCGNKDGMLDIDKLARGEACIESEGCWFAPPAFEDFGGRGVSKKWKSTIYYHGKPLGLLIEQGHLNTPGFKRRKSASTKKRKTPSPNSESESSTDESRLQSEEDVEEDDDDDDEDWSPQSRLATEELSLETEEEEERGEEEDGGEDENSGDDRGQEEEVDVEIEKEEGMYTDWFIIPGYEELGEKSGARIQTRLLNIPLKRLSADVSLPPPKNRLDGVDHREARRELFPSNHPDSPEEAEDWCKPIEGGEMQAFQHSEDERRDEDWAEREETLSTAPASTDASKSSTPDLPVLLSNGGVVEVNEKEEKMEESRGEGDSQREGELKTEKENSTDIVSETPLFMPTVSTQTSPTDLKPVVHIVDRGAGSICKRSVAHQDDTVKPEDDEEVGEMETTVFMVECGRVEKGEEWNEAEEEVSEGQSACDKDSPPNGDNSLLHMSEPVQPVTPRNTEENPSDQQQIIQPPHMSSRGSPQHHLPPSSIPNSTPSTSLYCSPSPHGSKKKNSSTRKRNPSLFRHQGCQAEALERGREMAMINILQRMSSTQCRIFSVLEKLCSKQDTVIELLQRLVDRHRQL